MKKEREREREREKEKCDTNSLLVWRLIFVFILDSTNYLMYFCFMFFRIIFSEYFRDMVAREGQRD